MNAKRFLRVPFVSLRGSPSSFQNSPACVLFGAATASVCLFTAGPSLDLFLGTLLLSAIIAPALAGDLTSTTPGSEACPVFDPEAQTRREPVERVFRRPGFLARKIRATHATPDDRHMDNPGKHRSPIHDPRRSLLRTPGRPHRRSGQIPDRFARSAA